MCSRGSRLPPREVGACALTSENMVGVMRGYSRHFALLIMAKKLRKVQVTVHAEVRPARAAPRRRIADRFTAAQLAGIVEEYRAGVATTALCRNHGLSKSAMLKILADAGVQMRMRPMTSDQIETARLLYKSGLSLSQVAERTGVHQTTVQRTLWRHGVTLRAPNGHDVVRREA